MSKRHENLEKAIIDKAMKEPAFMASLLQDPRGFLKSLAKDSTMRNLKRLWRWRFEGSVFFLPRTSRVS